MQDLHNCPGRYAVISCKLKQNANEGCNSCASLAGLVLCFIACFILLVIAPLTYGIKSLQLGVCHHTYRRPGYYLSQELL